VERQPRVTRRPDADADELRSLPSAATGRTVRGTVTVAGRGLFVSDVSPTLRNVFGGGALALQGQSLLIFLHPATAQQVCDALKIAWNEGATSKVVKCHMLVPVRRGAVGSFLPCSVYGTPKTERKEELVLSVEVVLDNDSESTGTSSGSVRVHGGADYSNMRRWNGTYTINTLESTASLTTIAKQLGFATHTESGVKNSWMVGRWLTAVWGFARRAAEGMSMGWLLDASCMETAILGCSEFGVEFLGEETVGGAARSGPLPCASCPTSVRFSVGARSNVFGIPKHMFDKRADVRLCGTIAPDGTSSSDPQSGFHTSSFLTGRPCSVDVGGAAADKNLVDLKIFTHGEEPRMRGYAILVWDFVEVSHRTGVTKRMHVWNTIVPPPQNGADEPGATGEATREPFFSRIVFDAIDQVDSV